MSVLLYFDQTMIVHDATKRLPECATIVQQQNMDSWEQWSSWAKWMPFVLPFLGPVIHAHCDLPFFKHFVTLFPRGSRLLSTINQCWH
jgi:hypothetical protein